MEGSIIALFSLIYLLFLIIKLTGWLLLPVSISMTRKNTILVELAGFSIFGLSKYSLHRFSNRDLSIEEALMIPDNGLLPDPGFPMYTFVLDIIALMCFCWVIIQFLNSRNAQSK